MTLEMAAEMAANDISYKRISDGWGDIGVP